MFGGRRLCAEGEKERKTGKEDKKDLQMCKISYRIYLYNYPQGRVGTPAHVKEAHMEQIYTIPVNEAFDAAAAGEQDGCPICALYRKLEENELDLILGASMMEPAIRIRTNQEGFCHGHYTKMIGRQNRLSLALMLESHLDSVKEMLADPALGAAGEKNVRRARELEGSCYLCGRIDTSLSRMIDTVVHLWAHDPAFPGKLEAQPRFCLPHFRALCETGRTKLGKKAYLPYYRAVKGVMERYLDKLRGDVSWFCKKFDYRYDAEPWYDAKDSIERAVAFLSATDAKAKEGKKKA